MKKSLLKKSAFIVFIIISNICFAQTPSMVMDINSGTGSCLYSQHIEYNGKVFFIAKSIYPGLWETDGTTAGTQQIMQSNYGFSSDSLIKMNDTLFFAAAAFNASSLYKSGGTSASTTIVKGFQSFYPTIKVMNGNLFFIAGASNVEGIWKSNGTNAGTIKLATIPGSSSLERPLIKFNNAIYFATYDMLYKTDGITADTVKTNIHPGNYIENFQIYNNELFFSSRDQLWKTDGTNTGTVLIKDFANSSAAISHFIVCNGNLYFDFNTQTYKSNGTDAGTSMFIPSPILERIVVNNTLFYTIQPNSFTMLYKTDGTLLEQVITTLNPSFLANINNTLYFSGHDTSGYELWTSGGTGSTTFKISTIPSTANGDLEQLTLLGTDSIMFYMDTPAYGSELWVMGFAGGSIPADPTLLSLNPVRMPNSTGFMELSWTDNANNETAFQIQRSPDGTTWAAIDSVLANVTTYTDNTTVSATVYYYRVAAYNSTGLSGYSNVVNGTALVSSINDASASNSTIMISPNPTSGIFQLSIAKFTTESIQLKVTDILGKVVYTEMLPVGINNHSIDLSLLSSGIYLLQGSSLSVQKLVIQK